MRREGANIILLHFLVVLAGILLFSLLPERPGKWLFFNSDALYMPSIYQDLFIHHSGLHVWHLNGAPNFFPEMLLYFPLMALLKSTTLSIMVYGVLQMLLILILIDQLLLLADVHIKPITRYLILLTYLLIPLSGVLNEGHLIPSQLLLGGYHAGFFINSLLGAILALSYLKNGAWAPVLMLGLLILLAVISDKLFIMGFVAPLVVFSLVQLFQRSKVRRYLTLITLGVLTTLLALFTYRMLNFTHAIDMISTGTKMFQFDQIPEALGNFLHHMRSVLIDYPTQGLLVIATALFLLASPVYLMTSLRKYLSRKMEPGREASWALILYLFLFVLFVLLTPIINGYYIDRSLIRYNYAALVMGAVGFVYLAGTLHAPFSLPSWLRKYFTSVCSLAFLALLLTVGVKNHASEGFHNYLNYYPEDVRILDELKSEYGLSYGLSGYWQAKHSTILSRNDLRLYSVSNGSFKPSYHVTNENWFHDGGKGLYANPTFNFLETSAYSDTRKLHKLFGDRIDTIYHDEKLLVIKVPDFKLRREDREIYLLDP